MCIGNTSSKYFFKHMPANISHEVQPFRSEGRRGRKGGINFSRELIPGSLHNRPLWSISRDASRKVLRSYVQSVWFCRDVRFFTNAFYMHNELGVRLVCFGKRFAADAELWNKVSSRYFSRKISTHQYGI